jgi:hypothetical protein
MANTQTKAHLHTQPESQTRYRFVVDLLSGFDGTQFAELLRLLRNHATPGDLAQLRDEVDEVLAACGG